MRILYISELFPDAATGRGVLGGGERQFYELSTRVARAGHDVTVITCRFPGQAEHDRVEGVRVLRTGVTRDPSNGGVLKSPAKVVEYVLKTSKVAVGVECDLIHCNTYYPVFPARCASLARSVPMVSTFHDLPSLRTWQEVTGSSFWGLMGLVAVSASVKAAAGTAIAVSLQTKAKLLSQGKTSVEVIPNGVDLDLLDARHSARREPRVLYVGRLVRYKRIDVLIRAFMEVTKDMPEAELTIVGEGPERPELEDLASQLPPGTVRFTGSLPSNSAVARQYIESSLFVLPSVTEGESIVLKEAMAASLPVIAVRVPGSGVLSLVRDGWNGYLVPPDDPHALAGAMTKLLADSELRRTLGTNGRAFAERWSWDRMADRVMGLYLNAVEHRAH